MKVFAMILSVVCATAAVAAGADVILLDNLSYASSTTFLETWTVVETGDEGMAWTVTGSAIEAANDVEGGGNNQSVIFGLPVDTTGYESIHVDVLWWANAEDDFEVSDFIRVQGYASGFPSEAARTIEATTEGLWVPGVNPPTTPTILGADFGPYSSDNGALWIAVEINTSLPREVLTVDQIVVTGTRIPEPSTLLLGALAAVGLLVRRSRLC